MPWALLLRLLPYLAAVGVVVGGLTWFGSHERDVGRAEVQAVLDRMVAEQSAQRAADEAAARAKEAQLRKEADDAISHAKADTAIARFDASRAAVAARNAGGALGGLREQLAAALAAGQSGAADPAGACAGSAAALQAGAVLADVCGQLVERARVVAEFADAASIAGTACQRQYLTLTCDPSPKPP